MKQHRILMVCKRCDWATIATYWDVDQYENGQWYPIITCPKCGTSPHNIKLIYAQEVVVMSKKKETNSTYEAVRKIRGGWGAISPVTKIIENKKKNFKIKHKGKQYDYE